MKVTCKGKDCGLVGKLGNSIRYVRLYRQRGKRISVLLCWRCESLIETRKRP